jgi:TPR repeat protein
MLEAIQALRGAVQREPDWIAPRLLLAETLLRTGDLDGAVGEFRRLTQRGQREPRAHLGLAKGLMAKQAWADAHVELRAAIREDPTLAEAHYLLGAVLYSQGRLRGAIEAYRKTLWLKPTFPDAHHQLGVLLKLANRHKEAVIEFRLAAEGGVPDAQFFLGQAYRNGTGVPVDLTQVVHWWIRATEQGHSQAWSSLKQLRRIARAENAAPASKIAADIQQAFTNYRASLWQEVPDLAHSDENDSAGLALLTQGRPEAVPLLIREAWSLSETAQAKLIELYAQGVPGSLPAFDARILRYLEFCATENRPDSKVELAHVYFLGLGVPKDPDRVKTLLKGLSKVERLRLLEEFANEQASK